MGERAFNSGAEVTAVQTLREMNANPANCAPAFGIRWQAKRHTALDTEKFFLEIMPEESPVDAK